MMKKGKFLMHFRRVNLVLGLSVTLLALALSPATAIDPGDPGKGFDYVFWGYSPPYGNGGSGNRAFLAIDIDEPNSPRPYPGGPEFKLWVENDDNSGRLDVNTITPNERHVLLPPLKQTDPERFIISHRENDPLQGNILTRSNSVLEPYNQHYLRSYIDVVHNNMRTRYLVDCPEFNCAEVLDENPYPPIIP